MAAYDQSGPERQVLEEPPGGSDVHDEGRFELTTNGHGGREIYLQDAIGPRAGGEPHDPRQSHVDIHRVASLERERIQGIDQIVERIGRGDEDTRRIPLQLLDGRGPDVGHHRLEGKPLRGPFESHQEVTHHSTPETTGESLIDVIVGRDERLESQVEHDTVAGDADRSRAAHL